jgi:WD40 repeat protein
MPKRIIFAIFCFVATLSMSGCLPVPVSVAPLHPRQARPIKLESALSENNGIYSCPVFDKAGERLAFYDSGAKLIIVARSSDLTTISKLKPSRRPKRLSFSPGGNYLIVEFQPGWIEEYLEGKTPPSKVDVHSPEAIRDDIKRAEVWNLQTGKPVQNVSCDAIETSAPQGGWLWAHNKVITYGYKSSALLTAQFSDDEEVLSLLCREGTQQRWNSRTWQRLDDLKPPLFWSSLMRRATALYWTGNAAAGRSEDGRITILSVPEKRSAAGTAYVWERALAQARKLPGDCDVRAVPVHALSQDNARVALICSSGLGYSLRVWDLKSDKEILLKGASFGMIKGAPLIRSEGVALSPDGRSLAAAILNISTTMVSARSDLRLWNLDRGEELAAVPIDDLIYFADYFRGVDTAFSPDSSLLAVAGKRLRIYHLPNLAQ